MVLSLLLVAALAAAQPAAAQSAQAAVQTARTINEGVTLADAGRDDEALEVFEAIAQGDPANHEARMWIARILARDGRTGEAEAVYRSVMLEDPANTEAAIGVAEALMLRIDADRAIAVLEAAESVAPNDPEVLGALGRAHRMAGHEAISRDYLQRAADALPTTPRLLAARDAFAEDASRFAGHTYAEHFDDGRTNALVEEMTLRLSLSERVRLIGRGQTGDYSGTSESRGGLGLEWRWTPATTIRLQALAGPGNSVIPRSDYLLGVAHTYLEVEVSGDLRVLHFPGVDVEAISPALVWRPNANSRLGVSYAATLTQRSTGPNATTHSAALSGDLRVLRDLWVGLGYAHGIEDFDRYTADYIGRFDADTGRVRLRVDLQGSMAIIASYERQWRTGDTQMDRVTVSVLSLF